MKRLIKKASDEKAQQIASEIQEHLKNKDYVGAKNLIKDLGEEINNKLLDDDVEQMKVVINTSYGGFGLSEKALELLGKKKGITADEANKELYRGTIERHDADLVAVVEQLGKEANRDYSELYIESIPKGIKYSIEEYDGNESVNW